MALVAVGERKYVDGIPVIIVLGVMPRRRGEAVVEEAQAAAGHVRHHAVEHLPNMLVGIEAVVQEHPQRPATLRRAKAKRVLHY